MKNYNGNFEVPEIVAKSCAKKPIQGFSYYNPIPLLQIGKVYYGNVCSRDSDTKSNVVRFKGIFMDMVKDYSVYEPVAVFMFETPKGEMIASRFFRGFWELFENKEDYLEFMATGDRDKSVTRDGKSRHMNSTLLFESAINDYANQRIKTSYNDFYAIQGYVWNQNSGQPSLKQYTNIKYAWIDENGPHIIFDDDSVYKDRAECVKANFKLDDDFKDEPSKEQTFQISVTLTIKAATKEDAERVAKEKIAYITE